MHAQHTVHAISTQKGTKSENQYVIFELRLQRYSKNIQLKKKHSVCSLRSENVSVSLKFN